MEATMSPQTTKGQKTAKILLIEDEKYHRALIKANLRDSEVTFLEAEDARKGLRLAREERPNLILMDIGMAPQNAWYALESIKKSSLTRDIPVIIVSVTDDEARMRALGADGYVRKPFRGDELRAKVGRYIGGN